MCCLSPDSYRLRFRRIICAGKKLIKVLIPESAEQAAPRLLLNSPQSADETAGPAKSKAVPKCY